MEKINANLDWLIDILFANIKHFILHVVFQVSNSQLCFWPFLYPSTNFFWNYLSQNNCFYTLLSNFLSDLSGLLYMHTENVLDGLFFSPAWKRALTAISHFALMTVLTSRLSVSNITSTWNKLTTLTIVFLPPKDILKENSECKEQNADFKALMGT